MKLNQLPPAEQLVRAMARIYENKMTTTSGGNLSIRDENGDIWITPSGIDKGNLRPADICRIGPDGTATGPHKPSVEWPFHAAIYKRRPDLGAVLHAHPPALVAFSLTRSLPDIRLAAPISRLLSPLSLATYALPGSQTLGANIASEFEKGFDIVLLENHGMVVGAKDMTEAYMQFESLERAAVMEINARGIGKPRLLAADDIGPTGSGEECGKPACVADKGEAPGQTGRQEMLEMIRRSLRQGLFGAALGTCSLRCDETGFLITPDGIDRAEMEAGDLLFIRQGQSTPPSSTARLHQLIYEKQPGIQAILGALPVHAMAFGITDVTLDPRTIPESLIMLKRIKTVPLGWAYREQEQLAAAFSKVTPVIIVENGQILATGASLLEAFDRLEVAEATAQSIIHAQSIGAIVHISDSEVSELDEAFGLGLNA